MIIAVMAVRRIVVCGPCLHLPRRGDDHMGMAAPTYYTADMVRALPDDGNGYDVVHGELLVTPSPRLWHQTLVARVFHALGTYLHSEPVRLFYLPPADISWRREVI